MLLFMMHSPDPPDLGFTLKNNMVTQNILNFNNSFAIDAAISRLPCNLDLHKSYFS